MTNFSYLRCFKCGDIMEGISVMGSLCVNCRNALDYIIANINEPRPISPALYWDEDLVEYI